jgi:hypothetical protein
MLEPFVDFAVYGCLWLWATVRCVLLGGLVALPIVAFCWWLQPKDQRWRL